MRSLFSKLWHQQKGATIIEFAIIAPIFFFIMFGILEFGLFMFHKLKIESITMEAGREATLGKTAGGPCSSSVDRVGYIQCIVKDKADGLINSERVFISVKPVQANNALGGKGTYVPDICMDNGQLSSAPATCTMFEEVNGTTGYQSAGTTSNADMGNYGELVEVRVNYPWHVVVPYFADYLGNLVSPQPDGNPVRSGVILITSSTIVRNEPL